MRFVKLQQHCNRIKRRKYLLQMIATCVALILLPFILSLILLCGRSYNQLLNTYQTYYLESAEKFAKSFSAQLNGMYSDSFILAADSRNTEKNAVGLDLHTIRQHSYYLYSAANIISEYMQFMPRFLGIYYYEIDRLVTGRAAWSSQQYWQNGLKLSIQDLATNEPYQKFFSAESNPLVFFVPRNQDMMYVGIRTKLGASRSDELLIYTFNSLSIDTSLLLSENSDDMQYLILDEKNNTLISFGKEYTKDFDLAGVLENRRQDGNFSFTETIDSIPFIISAYHDLLIDFTYLIILPLDQVSASLSLFYSSLQRILLIMGTVLLIAIGLLVYINYRPITKVLCKLSLRNKDLNEFEAISDELNRMTDEISEQNMVIVDSLLGNILYGIPLSDGMVNRIDIPADSSCFFVFTLSNCAIDTAQSAQITSELLQRFATRTYITNILFQDLIVLICMSAEDRKAEIFDYLSGYLRSNASPDLWLRQGETVSSVNEIKRSFDSNFTVSSGHKKPYGSCHQESIVQDPMVQLMQQIIAYIDCHFTDPMLSQSFVADHFRISTYSLSRLFKSKAGINFSEYVTSRRMQLAQELLQQEDNEIVSIAAQVGISSVNYFYKVFKAFTGTSPAKYRKSRVKEK